MAKQDVEQPKTLVERLDQGLLSTANLRRLSQVAAVLLFTLLLLLSIKSEANTAIYRGTLFFDFDPLILICAYLSAHGIEAALLLSLVVVVLTALFGRFYCGWVCPFGALHTVVGWLGRKYKLSSKRARAGYSRAQNGRYLVLGAVLASALFGGQLVGYLDPIALLERSFTTAVFPAIAWATDSTYALLARFDLGMVGNTVAGLAHAPYEGAELTERFHTGGVVIGLILLAFLGLNLVRERWFCRYLCPLGGLLSLLSKLSLVRIETGDACNGCMKCSRNCPTGAEPGEQGAFRVEACVYCYECTEVCPEAGIQGQLSPRNLRRPTEPPDKARRELFVGAFAGALSLPLIKSEWRSKRVSPLLIRPPGSRPEQEFLSRCVRCGACMRACPTNVLQPAAFEGGLDGLWTPLMRFRYGYCQYGCTLCAAACPTGAIDDLSLEDKQQLHIGTAFFDKNRCLPFAFGRECTVCEEHCPTAPKAIVVRERELPVAGGGTAVLKVPEVDPVLCIGCGICEHVCPIVDEAGIRITSVGEERNEENRFLLRDERAE